MKNGMSPTMLFASAPFGDVYAPRRRKCSFGIFTILRCVLAVVVFVGISGNAGAVEEVLIDFSLLSPDTPVGNPIHESSTLLAIQDLYPTNTGISLTDSERELVQLSLAIPHWKLTLNSSARHPHRIRSSSIRPASVNQSATRHAGLEVLGLRVNFAEGDGNSWALIEPPYVIPRIPQRLISGRDVDFGSRGVVTNVSQIQSISAEIYGLNYPHRISVLFEDTDGTVREALLGDLNFVGWRTLTWENHRYAQPTSIGATDTATEEIASENEISIDVQQESGDPLYPLRFPSVAFRGIRIWKNGAHLTGDFIGYIKDIKINYDPQEIIVDADFDHEGLWNVLTDEARQQNRKRQIEQGSGDLYRIIKINTNN